jgi:transcription elongation factor GreA
MVTKAIPRNTVTIMLLQEKNSPRSVNGRSLRPAIGAIPTSDEVPVTAAAREALEQNLASLRVEQRAIPARLRVAREFGDTANNDEHLAIREEEAVLASRIARLEDILSRATEVEHAPVEESVTIGSTVAVLDVDTKEKLEYVIGSAHGVLSRGTVSALSPVGRALLGRRVGERVAVQLPHGRWRELELSEIRHAREL